MPRHSFGPLRGRVETFTIESASLRDNLLGDPAERLAHVYLPEGYDEDDARYPLFMALAGFAGSGSMLLSWQAFGESLPQRLDRLGAEGRMGKVVCVMPDCFTSLGGNQYVDSPVMGYWERFLLHDLIPEVRVTDKVAGTSPVPAPRSPLPAFAGTSFAGTGCAGAGEAGNGTTSCPRKRASSL